MNYFLTRESVIKRLEIPSVYHISKDDLYELDEDSFEFLKTCGSENGCISSTNEFINYCLEEDILTKDRVALKRPALMKSPVPSLRYLELQITDTCNLRCKHCYISHPPHPPLTKGACLSGRQGRKGGKEGIAKFSAENYKELSINQINTVLHEFEEMQGLRVLITGGEPLLHSRFNEINAMLPDFFLRKILFTNGLLLTQEILAELNVHEIQFSIDGLEDAHDAIRGKGTYTSALEAIKRSINAGFEVSVSTMVHTVNLGDFDEMDSLFKGLGIKDWTVDIPCITGRLVDNTQFQVTPEQGGKYLGYGYGDGLHSGASGFGCGLHLMAVMADSAIAKCTFYRDQAVGTIDDGLRACWERIHPIRLEELECNCEYLESCRGGCRYRAEVLGKPSGKDLYRCILYDIIKKQ